MAKKQNIETSDTTKMGKVGYRPFWILKLSIVLRAIHQVGAAVFLSSFLLKEVNGPPMMYLLLAGISGAALLLAEGMRHRQIYRELSGLSTIIKLILLGLAYHGLFPQTITVVAVFLLASISSHAPKLYRHRLFF
jgi:hypothetical protein